MPSGWRIRTVRADSGFFAQALLAYLEECGLPYIIVARMTKQVQGQFVNSAIHWREIDQGYAVGRRLIDVPGYTYRIWVTNRSEATETLWRDYNQRATIEQRIEELKNDMHADGFCAKKFYTTEAAFLGTILAYNLLSLYQAHVTAKEGWRKPSTLRAAVFVCGAILGRAGRKLVLRLSKSGGGLAKHRALIDKARKAKTAIAPPLPRPRTPTFDWDILNPGGEGI